MDEQGEGLQMSPQNGHVLALLGQRQSKSFCWAEVSVPEDKAGKHQLSWLWGPRSPWQLVLSP